MVIFPAAQLLFEPILNHLRQIFARVDGKDDDLRFFGSVARPAHRFGMPQRIKSPPNELEITSRSQQANESLLPAESPLALASSSYKITILIVTGGTEAESPHSGTQTGVTFMASGFMGGVG